MSIITQTTNLCARLQETIKVSSQKTLTVQMLQRELKEIKKIVTLCLESEIHKQTYAAEKQQTFIDSCEKLFEKSNYQSKAVFYFIVLLDKCNAASEPLQFHGSIVFLMPLIYDALTWEGLQREGNKNVPNR